jgi:pyruvate kinase
MVARGDLGMEIPSEKVALAQKMLITKCNIAGKFCICATQMLESMCENPLPTRAEMTDVANAVFDGADATMLSGETANGAFPAKAVATMAAINANAELGIDYWQQYAFLHRGNAGTHTITTLEASLANVALSSVEFSADKDGDGVISADETVPIVVLTEDGVAADLITKYRPPSAVFVATNSQHVVNHTNVRFGQIPVLLGEGEGNIAGAVKAASEVAKKHGIPFEEGNKVLVVSCKNDGFVHIAAVAHTVTVSGGAYTPAPTEPMPTTYVDPGVLNTVVSKRGTRISLEDILTPAECFRKTKTVCTMGPKCWDEETMRALLREGMGVARFNFSHGDHEAQQAVLDRYREACKKEGAAMKEELGLDYTPHWACLLDTKGPEIRTAMLRDGQPIELEKNQPITIEAVGDAYTEFQGYKTDEETRIGLSYAKLCQSVKPGNNILIADGSISIRVDSIESDTVLKGTVLNTKKLGERKNCNLPGVKVDIPVLTAKDINDVQNFCCKNEMDFIAASFVQTGEDVQLIRKVLDEAGGQNVQIISKIENEEGVANIDAILKYSDGIMVARGDLGMEIPSQKVALAQKMLITKANVAGRFAICATQMLESMCDNPLPTRAEMTDVANAVFDGADATMLSGETANGAFPAVAVSTMAAINANAELAKTSSASISFLRDFTQRPFTTIESAAASAAMGAVDCAAELIVVISGKGAAAKAMSKYRPPCPILVVTADAATARQTGAYFGQYAMKVDDLTSEKFAVDRFAPAITEAKALKLMKEWQGMKRTPSSLDLSKQPKPQTRGGNIIVIAGPDGGDADKHPVVSFL